MAIKTIQAPISRVFYRRPAPEQPPFKYEDDAVAVGDTLGLIEVMKTFSPVVAEEAGRLVRFLVDNKEPIMAGRALAEIDG